MLEQKPRLTKERIAILASWFGLLVGIRFLLGFALEGVWIGTLGAVAITFAIFYVALKHTPLARLREVVNSALAVWYRRKFFYISGAVSMAILAGIMIIIEYGYANYGDRLVTMNMSDEELEETLRLFSGDAETVRTLSDGLSKHSAPDVVAITLASADKSFSGYYSKIVGFMFAEDIEIMIFLTVFRSRKEIFTPHSLNLA